MSPVSAVAAGDAVRVDAEALQQQIEELQEDVARKLGGFRITRHKLELYGLCPKAQGVPGGFCPHDQAAAQARVPSATSTTEVRYMVASFPAARMPAALSSPRAFRITIAGEQLQHARPECSPSPDMRR